MKLLQLSAIFLTLPVLFACSSADDASRYNYNWTYGMACGSQISINGAPWQELGGSIAVEGGRSPVRDLVNEKFIESRADGDVFPVAAEAEDGARRAAVDINRSNGPLLGQCIKSARYVARINRQYGFEESAKSWAALAAYLGRFKSYPHAVTAR